MKYRFRRLKVVNSIGCRELTSLCQLDILRLHPYPSIVSQLVHEQRSKKYLAEWSRMSLVEGKLSPLAFACTLSGGKSLDIHEAILPFLMANAVFSGHRRPAKSEKSTAVASIHNEFNGKDFSNCVDVG